MKHNLNRIAMLLIQTPAGSPAERDYILGVILTDFLGLPWVRVPGAADGVRIHLQGAVGEIGLPDLFLPQSDVAWLSPASQAMLPLATWDTRELTPSITMVDPRIPVLFGAACPVASHTGDTLILPIDIFGAAFFMLSRYEEAVLPDRDNHNRFPAMASLACQSGFIERPIVDEYVEILWYAIQRLWPGLRRKLHRSRTLVSCDLDRPFSYSGNLKEGARQLLGDLLKRKSGRLAFRNWRANWRLSRGDDSLDAHSQAIDWMMSVNEAEGQIVTFNVIPENTHLLFDNEWPVNSPLMRRIVRRIHERGHEIGLHPGYNTYNSSNAMARSVGALRLVLKEENISQPLLGARQHYLRFDICSTPDLLQNNNITYDSTLGYPDTPGFRCGTCHEYRLYSLTERRTLKLVERPLVLMESALLQNGYRNIEQTEFALEKARTLREICFKFRGGFSLLWHNSFNLGIEVYRKSYLDFIKSTDGC